MIADVLSNKKLNPIVTELFNRGRKLKISLLFITRSYFAVPKNAPFFINNQKFKQSPRKSLIC